MSPRGMVQARIPPNHRWCNLCGTTGRNCRDRRRKCEACRGKGYWNAEDIRLYHEAHPSLCKTTCGDTHRAPDLRTQEERDRDWNRLVKSLASARRALGQ